MYCEFMDDEDFKELYEMKADPWQLTNVAYENSSAIIAVREQMSNLLERFRSCSGASCHIVATSATAGAHEDF